MSNPGRPAPDSAWETREVARLEREIAELRHEPATTDSSAPDNEPAYNEAHYRTLLDLSPQVVWIGDAEGNNIYVNRYWCEFTGMSPEQSRGRGWTIALHPDDVGTIRETWMRAVTHGMPYEEELRLRRASDGQYRWQLMRGVPLRSASGTVARWIGVAIDVHDRKIARAAIAQANERTSMALEAADIGTWELDPATGAIECSARSLEIFQRPNPRPQLEDFFGAVHRDDRERVRQALRRAIDPVNPEPYDIEYRIIWPDHTVRWIHAKGKGFFTSDAAACVATHFSGMVIDVTEQRAMERDRASLAAALQHSPDLIGITDVSGRVLFLNRSAQRALGVASDEEARTKTAFDFLAAAERALVEHEMLPTVLDGKVWEREFTMRHTTTGEPILVETRVFGIFDAQGRLTRMVNHSRDISEKRKLDERLHMAQKMEAIGRLAGGVAHDFNNLLTIIRGATEMLQEGKPGTRIDDVVAEIGGAAERASALTDELLAFGRLKVVRPKAISINRAILAIQNMLQRLAGEDVTFRIELDDNLYNVKIDPVQIDQVLINLVANARDALPHGGEIRIHTSNQQPKSGSGESNAPEYACLFFSDNGQGMPPQAVAHIFEPFFTTKHKSKNSGLGLATIYGIVQQANGHIEVSSARGQGTAFKIFLPRTHEEIAVAEPPQTSTPPAATGTILLVEDETALRTILAAYLRDRGFQVFEAAEAREAGAIAEKNRIDLLLTDIVMPGISGATLASALVKAQPHVKVIFMSGYADHGELKAALQRNNAVFLHKPFRFGDLMPQIHQALAEREPAPKTKQ